MKKRSSAQVAAITRAAKRLEDLPATFRIKAYAELDQRYQKQLMVSMSRGGYSELEIRSYLLEIVRRRKAREIAEERVRVEVFGRERPKRNLNSKELQGAVDTLECAMHGTALEPVVLLPLSSCMKKLVVDRGRLGRSWRGY